MIHFVARNFGNKGINDSKCLESGFFLPLSLDSATTKELELTPTPFVAQEAGAQALMKHWVECGPKTHLP